MRPCGSRPTCFEPSTCRLGSERALGRLGWPEDDGLDTSGQPGTRLGPSHATDTDDGEVHQSHQDHGFLPRHHARGDERVGGITTGSSRKAHAEVRETRSPCRHGRLPARLGRGPAGGDVEVKYDNHDAHRQGTHEHDEAEPTSHVRRLPGPVAGRPAVGSRTAALRGNSRTPLLKPLCSKPLCSNEAYPSSSRKASRLPRPWVIASSIHSRNSESTMTSWSSPT